MRTRLGLMVSLALLGAVALAASAHAAFPGANGKIAFTRDNPPFHSESTIWTINPDGTGETQLTSVADRAGEPAWSPDGRKLAFTRDSSIYLMNADGTGVVRLTDHVPHNPPYDWGPAWSPDGERIVFVRDHDYLLDVYVMNADGSGLRPLTTSGHASQPAWSPDGQKIAFTGYPGRIETVNATDGSGETVVTSGGDYGDGDPSWSPDGSKIAFDRYQATTEGDEYICCPDVFVVNADGTNEFQLTHNFNSISPAWAPDGSKIAFADWTIVPLGRTVGLWEIGVDGTGLTRVSSTPTLSPDWQPIPEPQRQDFKNAAQYCKAKREFLGRDAFEHAYGSNGLGRCVTDDGG